MWEQTVPTSKDYGKERFQPGRFVRCRQRAILTSTGNAQRDSEIRCTHHQENLRRLDQAQPGGMEERAARECHHAHTAVQLHHRQERHRLGDDHRRDGHPAQQQGRRVLHHLQRQRLHASCHPSARVEQICHRHGRAQDATPLHRVVRQVHLHRKPWRRRRGDRGKERSRW